MSSAGRREALLVASYDYDDPGLRQLRAPAHDADALARVLGDPQIGDFAVRQLRNEPAHVISEALEEFFADRHRDDVLLVHFSCHGIKDEAGHLYLAAATTKLSRLAATGIPAAFVNQQMDLSRSCRIVLLLDCCYAGAFARGLTPRAGSDLGIDQQLSGRGRAVITASSAMEYSFEGGTLAGGSAPQPVGSGAGQSVFTGALVRGLATGAADRDHDGLITLDELYDYIYAEVREITPHQSPGKWIFDMRGSLHIARCPATASATRHHAVATTVQDPATVGRSPVRRSDLAHLAARVRRVPRKWALASALAGSVALSAPFLLRDGWPAAHPASQTEGQAATLAAGPTIFHDDFSTQAAGWPDTAGTGSLGGYHAPGVYRYWSKKPGQTWWVTPANAAAVYPIAPANIR